MNPENSSSTILRGRWLILARAAWLVVATLIVSLFVAGIPLEFAQLQLGCPTPACASSGGLTPVELRLLENIGLSPDFFAAYGVALEVVFAVVFVAVAGLIFWRKSADRLALFVALVLLTFGTATHPNTLNALTAAYPVWRLPVAALHFVGSASFSLFLYLFPDGRFVPRWTRWVALAWIAWLLPRYWFPDWPPSGSDTWLAWLNLVVWSGALGAAVYAQIYRYRRVSNQVQRQQTKWVVFGITLALTGFLSVNVAVSAAVAASAPTSAGALATLMAGAALMYGALLLIPLSIGIAILRYHLFDVNVLINGTLVYGTLTACVIGLYVLVVGYLGVLFRTGSNLIVSLLATGLVAVLFQPLRDRLQRGVNRLVYGERDDPYAALSRLGRRLEVSLAPEAVLPTVVTTVREVLKLPYVAIYLKQDDDSNKIVAESASSSLHSENGRIRVLGMEREGLCMPLIHQGETLGYMVLGPRAPNEAFNSTDRRLLEDLAPQVGVAVHAVRLTADLQRSRQRLVLAREEERRRLRRDLHDGLGPQLAGLTLKLEAARNRLANDPLADSLLADLAKRTQDATADIRHLVYELRPPTLDELGLVSALREGASQYSQQGLNGVHIMIDAPDNLPALPAAVEVAVYRITQEALTNVVRHAGAHTCNVRLSLDEEISFLCLEIQDDGRGLSSMRRAGVGLSSMRERAEELGGTWTIESIPTGGTRILAKFPCRLPDSPSSKISEEI